MAAVLRLRNVALPSLGRPVSSVINALFEAVSGYTTTGATILTDVEQLPDSLLFWRSSTHFIGGLGVVVFLLLIIPSSSPMRLRLTNMEVSSLSKEGYRTRTNKTVWVFAAVYLGITVSAFLCYWLAGMLGFRCHKPCLQRGVNRRIQHQEPVYRLL